MTPALLLLIASLPVAAQDLSTAPLIAPLASAPPIISTGPYFGIPLPPERGPWVLGDVRFRGAQTLSEYALQSKVRARRGNLYMPEDVQGDISALLETGSFDSVTAAVYAIADQPVPAGYATIAVSTSMARLVYTLQEKPAAGTLAQAPGAPAKEPEPRTAPSPVSGVVFTPTAYRGFGRANEPGLGLDINAVYYIGRLYGKNSLDYTLRKTNYLDRVGVWFLIADGKLQLQSEGNIRPAMAVGAQGVFTARDAGQPNIVASGVTIQVSQKTTRALADAYLVFSKRFGRFWSQGLRTSVGYMQGNFGDSTALLTEFLSPQALRLGGHANQSAQSKSVFFFNLLTVPKPAYPLAVEFMKPNGMALSPFLLNLKLGYFLKLNFDLAYVKFKGGWDLLGMFQFRTNYFPRR